MLVELYHQSSFRMCTVSKCPCYGQATETIYASYVCSSSLKSLCCNFASNSGQLCAIKEVRVVCDDQTSKECLKQLNQVILLFFKIYEWCLKHSIVLYWILFWYVCSSFCCRRSICSVSFHIQTLFNTMGVIWYVAKKF